MPTRRPQKRPNREPAQDHPAAVAQRAPEELALVIRLRRVLHALDSGAALELLIDKLRATKSNEQFLKDIAKAPTGN